MNGCGAESLLGLVGEEKQGLEGVWCMVYAV